MYHKKSSCLGKWSLAGSVCFGGEARAAYAI